MRIPDELAMTMNPRAPKKGQTLSPVLQAGTQAHYEDAALYDLEYEDRTADIQWYRAIAGHDKLFADGAKARTLLELGAGTGRISIPLAQDGHEVLALDRMDSMLERLRAKVAKSPGLKGDVRPIQGDLLDIPKNDASLDLVIAPFNVLMHLYDRKALRACFDEAYRVLKPGGIYALDVLLPDLEWLTWDPETRHAVTRFKDPHTQEWRIYSTNHTYDPKTQVCHIKLYYDKPATPRSRSLRGSTLLKTVELAHRQIFPEELRMLADQSGFEILCHDGDFGQSELEDGVESQSMCLLKR